MPLGKVDLSGESDDSTSLSNTERAVQWIGGSVNAVSSDQSLSCWNAAFGVRPTSVPRTHLTVSQTILALAMALRNTVFSPENEGGAATGGKRNARPKRTKINLSDIQDEAQLSTSCWLHSVAKRGQVAYFSSAAQHAYAKRSSYSRSG
jgi:hypothetical protein